MTCGSCVARVKSELLKIGDVVTADVQLQSPQATISMSKHIATDLLQAAVSKAGSYTISEESGHLANSISTEAGSSEVPDLCRCAGPGRGKGHPSDLHPDPAQDVKAAGLRG